MVIHELQADNQAQPAQLRTASLPKPALNRKVLAMGRNNGCGENGIEEILSSALIAADDELGQILREVDDMSRTLRADAPDTQTLKVAHHPAVWCALKQTLLDRELR